MGLLPSAHVDTFCRDHLPPADQWPELLFTLPELAYPDRLNCATALLDDVIARHGADRPCLIAPGRRDLDATPTCWPAPNRVAHVLVDDLGLVPGNRVLLRGPNNPWLAACWFGVLKAGGVVVATMPLLRAGELATIHEIASLDARTGRPSLPRRRQPGSGLPTIAYGGDAPDDLTPTRQRRSPRPSTTWRRPATTWPCWRSRPVRRAGRRRRCTSTATCSRSCDTFSRHVLRPTPDDVFTGTPPLAFTFGLGARAALPAARRRLDASRREGDARPSWRR